MFGVTEDAHYHITDLEDLAVESIPTQLVTVGFFPKPFDDEQLLAAVYNALGTAAGMRLRSHSFHRPFGCSFVPSC